MKSTDFCSRFGAVCGALVAIVLLAGPAAAQSPTRMRLIASPTSPLTLTAEVDGLGGGAPTGSVAFYRGGTVLGGAWLRATGAGQATLAARGDTSCALTANGGVKCWGRNYAGQIGDGSRTDRLTPVDVVGLSRGVVAVATGGSHSCALTVLGGVKCWGANWGGQLGDGTTTDRYAPADVSGLSSGVLAIASGYAHTCALTGAGGVKCWGSNWQGALGDGTTIDRSAPADVVGLRRGVAAISAGGGGLMGPGPHSCALTSAGGVKCWGANAFGELGDRTRIDRLTPVDVSGLSGDVVAITAGSYHSCALTVPGGVKCWGNNYFGQLGIGGLPDRGRVSPVATRNLVPLVRSVARLPANLPAGLETLSAIYTGNAAYRGSTGTTRYRVQ